MIEKSALLSSRPDLAAQWVQERNGDVTPDDVTLGSSSTNYYWRCVKKGCIWPSPVYARAQGHGCGVCAGKRVQAGVNDLGSQEPTIAKEWAYDLNGDLTPQQVTVASSKEVWWRCSKWSHPYPMPVKNRTRRGFGCTVCSGNRVLAGVNDLGTVRPGIAAQWSSVQPTGLTPQDVTEFSHKVVNWDCPRGHHWPAAVCSRTAQGSTCTVCLGWIVWHGFNDLASQRPDIAKYWHPTLNGDVTAADVTVYSNSRAWWLCDEGHETQAFVYARAAGNKCYDCSLVGPSQLEDELAAVIAALVPDQQIVRSDRKLLGDRREVDIYLPGMGIAVEFNGVAWHSEKFGRDAEFHARKTIDARGQSVRLIHVWEDDWLMRRDVVIRSLAHRLGATANLPAALPGLPEYFYQRVGARSLRVARVTATAMGEFLDANHIQGATPGTAYLALVDADGRIRAGLVVKNRGKSAPGDWEIARYATSGVVPGGFSRLLAEAQRSLAGKVKRWVTFADRAISDGDLYERTGFEVDGELAPDYAYTGSTTNWRRVHKFNYRIKRFRTDPALVWQDGLSERELAALNGLHRVWDAGKTRYVRAVS